MISEPVATSIKRVWTQPPPGNVVLSDLPAIVNRWAFFSSTEEAWGFRLDRYTLQVQLYVDDASQERAYEIITAFHQAITNAFFREPGIDGTVFEVTLRGAGATMDRLEWAGKSYPGLTLFFDMALVENARP